MIMKKIFFAYGYYCRPIFEHMGGKVIILGKPSKEIYIRIYKEDCRTLDLTKVIAIGDSMEHDILGA